MMVTNHHLPNPLLRRHSVATWERWKGLVTRGLWLFLRSKDPLGKPLVGWPEQLSTVNTTSTTNSINLSHPLPRSCLPIMHTAANRMEIEEILCLISIGQGLGEGRRTERSGDDERSRIWRRVKPQKGSFMVWLGPGLLASGVYWSPRILNSWEMPPLPISLLPTGILADLAILRNLPLV